jgi:hypothetical protein
MTSFATICATSFEAVSHGAWFHEAGVSGS